MQRAVSVYSSEKWKQINKWYIQYQVIVKDLTG
jgi:hypothetical protein